MSIGFVKFYIWLYFVKLSARIFGNLRVQGQQTALPGDGEGGTVACQISLAVFMRTPGPIVEAATQLRIYWPFAAAGFAFTMAFIRTV